MATKLNKGGGIEMIRLSRKGFRKWLQSHVDPTEVVGYARSSGSCPIAFYLRSLGAKGVGVTRSEYQLSLTGHGWTYRNQGYVRLALWSQRFINMIDDLRSDHQDRTAEECLTVLDFLEARDHE